jgi:glycosyltransferase involved in cell wall biosynthesis
MVDTSNFSCLPDERVVERFAKERAGGGHDWLFVGQMLPHKAHQDVIKALACARKLFDPRARLHLVGRESCPAYADALRRYVSFLGLDGAVDFAGSVSAAELAGYYTSADVFVCCSDHEGFCAPLLEAMHHELPIVAYGVTAVPETVLDAGIVLPTKSPVLVATAVQRVMSDATLRAELVRAGLERAKAFSIEGARRGFADCIELVLQGL